MKLINIKLIKNHLFLILLLVIIVILFGSLHMLSVSSQKFTLAIETLAGNISVLDNVLITGELSNGYYATPFDIQKGTFNYTTTYITHAKQDYLYSLAQPSAYDSFTATLYDTYSFYFRPIFNTSKYNNGQILDIAPTDNLSTNDFSSLDYDRKYLTVTRKTDTINLHIALNVLGHRNKFDFSTPKISNFESGNNVYFDTNISLKRPTADIILIRKLSLP